MQIRLKFIGICVLVLLHWLASPVLSARDFDEEKFREATEGLNYVEKPVEEKQEKTLELEPDEPSDTGIYLGKGQIVLVVILAVLVIVLIVLLVRNVPPPNPNATGQDAWFSGLLEADGSPADALQQAIDDAIRQQNYNLALRLHYLQAIALLHKRGWIQWKKDKTDAAYVRELSLHKDAGLFRQITLHYEYWWFGKHPLDETRYQRLRDQNLRFQSELKEEKS